MKKLYGKVALVTGASRGIGRAIAFALGEAGVFVALNYRSREEEARQTRAQLAGSGIKAIAVQADASIGSDVDRMIGAVEAGLGPVEILANNAGVARPQRIEEVTEGDWDFVVDVNLKSCFLVSQGVLPGMRARRWGRIINLASAT